MKKLCIVIWITIISGSLFAQNILSTKNYANMQNVSSVGSIENLYFASTSGGLFIYDTNDESFIIITKVEGLSSHNLTSLSVDETGKVWVGTMEGIINVYDLESGGEIRRILDIYNSDKNQKQINHITSNGDNIFVATNFGVSILSSTSESFNETILRFGSFPAESKVNSTHFDSRLFLALDAGVAIQKEGALNLSSPDSWESYNISQFASANSVNAITTFNSNIYAATNKGVFKLELSSWIPVYFEGENVIDIVSRNNSIYFLLDHSLYEFNGSDLNRLYINNETNLTDFAITSNSKYILGSDSGILEIGTEVNKLLAPDGPAANSFLSLTVDYSQKLWVGSGKDQFGVGVFSFDGTEWDNFSTSTTPEFLSNSFHKVQAFPDSTVYFMNWGQGYTKYANGTFETVSTLNSPMVGIPGSENFLVVTGIQKDSRGNLWVLLLRSANRAHLNVLTTNGQWYQYSIDQPYVSANDDAQFFVIDQFDNKWFAITNGNKGLYYFNENGTFENKNDDVSGRLTESDGLRNNAITSLAIDKRGELWVGTTQGISIIPNPSSRIVNTLTGGPVRGQNINCIAVDPVNRKWLGTNQGLFLMSSDGISALEFIQSSNSALPSDEIKSVAIDNAQGIVYVGTDFGLTAFETSSIAPVDSYSELKIFPNPFIVGSSFKQDLAIDGLVENSTIRIMSISGKLIRELATTASRLTFWDGRDENGEFVSSGVYIIIAYDEGVDNVAKAKVAVFNK
ncbi:MAG: hypothetical protein KKA84_11225 [Bacteroidetes bacterium]|nr:hypothetical protein [Bacteroidota bacterium]